MLETRKKTYSRRSIVAAKPTTTSTRRTTRYEDDDDDVNVVSAAMRKRRGRRREEEDFVMNTVTEWKEAQEARGGGEDEEGDERKEESGARALFTLRIRGNDPRNFVSSFAHRSRRGENESDGTRGVTLPVLDERNVFEPPSRVESRRSELKFVLQRDGTFNRGEASFGTVERQTETSGGYRAGVRKHRVGAVEIKAVHSEKDAV